MKMRKTGKAYIAAVMFFSAAFLCAGCKTKADPVGESETKTASDEEEMLNNTEAAESDIEEESPDISRANDHGETDMYNHVLAQYSDMVRNNFYMVLRDTDTYESSFGEDIGVEIRTHKQDIYYTL